MAALWDVIVVGLGAMGSATVRELALRGTRVLGIDRFHPPHAWGSSHGETRIIREAYFEHPLYVPLVQRAFVRWAALERDAETPLGLATGGLMIGAPDGGLVAGALDSARQHGLAHEVLDAPEIERRYPAFRIPGAMTAIWEPRAGVLFPERCIDAHLRLAVRDGADVVTDTPVLSWEARADAVRVWTSSTSYEARVLVLSPGAWMSTLIPSLEARFTVERQTLHWFQPGIRRDQFLAERFPIFLLEHAPGRMVYGIPEVPAIGPGVKIARHHEGAATTADALARQVGPQDAAGVEAVLGTYLPDLTGGWLRSAVCMYTNTADEHFVLDWLPGHPNVLAVSACSGHGFKFSSVIGEIAADLATGVKPAFDLSPFHLARFA